jgi:hypothetical protein
MYKLDPRKVYSSGTCVISTYGDILLESLWYIGDDVMEIVDIYDPMTKKFSQYRGSEFIMKPVTHRYKNPTKYLYSLIANINVYTELLISSLLIKFH